MLRWGWHHCQSFFVGGGNMGKPQTEPVAIATGGIAAASALFIVLRSFGIWQMTDEQFQALMAFVAILIPLLAGFWIRAQVTPVASPRAENTRGEIVPLVPADGSQLKK